MCFNLTLFSGVINPLWPTSNAVSLGLIEVISVNIHEYLSVLVLEKQLLLYDKKLVVCQKNRNFVKKLRSVILSQITISTKSQISIPFVNQNIASIVLHCVTKETAQRQIGSEKIEIRCYKTYLRLGILACEFQWQKKQ